MLTEASQLRAAGLAAKHFENPLLNASVDHAASAETRFFLREVSMLNSVVRRVNALRNVDAEQRDPNLVSIYDDTMPSFELPELFAWKDRAERKEWTDTLKDTIITINQEAGAPDGYKDPEEIDDGNFHDVFRWYFLDGYALWAAKRTNPQDKAQEEARAGTIVNALCEAALVEAEEGNAEMKTLVTWMVPLDWFAARYGFSENVEARAKGISQAA